MTQPITVDIPHQLGAAEARRRLEDGFGRIGQQLAGLGAAHVQHNWEGDTLSFSATAIGQVITGRIEVMPERVHLQVVLPGVLGLLAGKLKGRLQREGQLLLEKK